VGQAKSGGHKVKLARALSEIVSLVGVKFKGKLMNGGGAQGAMPPGLTGRRHCRFWCRVGDDELESCLTKQLAMEMASFGEKKAMKLSQEEELANLFVRRNARQLARTCAQEAGVGGGWSVCGVKPAVAC
jgi:hypothetical protein